MVNSRASKGLELLYSYTSASTEASATFTPKSVLTKDSYKFLKFVIHGTTTAALAIEMTLSGGTTNHTHQILNDSQVLSGTYAAAATEIELIPATLIDAARDFIFTGEIYFGLADIEVTGTGKATSEGTIQTQAVDPDMLTISEIKFQTSTSTWIAGTQIYIWGQR